MRERETVTHGASPSWRRVLAQDRRGEREKKEKKKRRGVWWIGVSSFLGTRLYIVHVYFFVWVLCRFLPLPCVTAIRGGKTPIKDPPRFSFFSLFSNSLFTNGAACTIFDSHIIIAINKITTTTAAAPKRCIFLPNNTTPGLFPPSSFSGGSHPEDALLSWLNASELIVSTHATAFASEERERGGEARCYYDCGSRCQPYICPGKYKIKTLRSPCR